MKARVIVGERVKDFLESLAPEPRRKLWRAIKGLPEGKGAIKPLAGRLAPYWRPRAGRLGVIYQAGARGRAAARGRCFVHHPPPRSFPSWRCCAPGALPPS